MMRCLYSSDNSTISIDEENDLIIIKQISMFTKFAIPYGLAQSVKLSSLENSVERLPENTQPIHEELARKGEICLSKNIHPKNLNTHDRFNVAFSNDILNSQLQSIEKKYIKDAINASITHFQLQCKSIKEELDDLQNSLKEICSVARIRILTSKLNSHRKKMTYQLSIDKDKKISKLLSNKNTTKVNVDNNTWIPEHFLKLQDKSNIINGEELDNSIISTSMELIKKDFPQIIHQPPTLYHSTGFEYCPFETLQIVNNEAHHWVLISSLKGKITIYDSLNKPPTNSLIKQLTQLFSPDASTPPFEQIKCAKQHGSTD